MAGVFAKLSNRRSRAITMIEMMFYMVVVAIVVGAAIALFTRQKASEYHTRKVRQTQVLLGAMESAKTANGGSYPAAPNPIDLSLPESDNSPAAKLLAPTLGRNNADYKDWKYQCGTDNKVKITINVKDTNNSDLRNMVYRSVLNSIRDEGWGCTADYDANDTFTCEKAASCR